MRTIILPLAILTVGLIDPARADVTSRADALVIRAQRSEDTEELLVIRRTPLRADGVSGDLVFTFNSPGFDWTTEERLMLDDVIRDAYPRIVEIFGSPYRGNVVNVRKATSLGIAGYYDAFANEIVLAETGELLHLGNVFVHELVHAFRDEAIIEIGSYEEGMARATEVAVMNQMPQFSGHVFARHGYTYDVFYDSLNRDAAACPGNGVNCGDALTLLRYQLGGYAWGKAIIEQREFLAAFNRRYYDAFDADPSVRADRDRLRLLVSASIGSVESLPADLWLKRQKVTQRPQEDGCYLFHRVNQFTFDFFCRNGGTHEPQSGTAIAWKILDTDESEIASGIETTTPLGWASLPVGAVPPLSQRRITVVAAASTMRGEFRAAEHRFWNGLDQGRGLFGIARNATAGEITVEYLDAPRAATRAALVRGAFEIAEAENYSGRLRVSLLDERGRRFSRVITKDAAPYHLIIDDTGRQRPVKR